LVATPTAQGFVYWANDGGTTIGRAYLDGSGVNQSFIGVAGGTGAAYGVAVDGARVYWANQSTNTIGRANLDGSGVNQSFITAPNSPQMVAVDSAHLYWANYNNGTIGRADLDGNPASVNQSFITTGSPAAIGVAVDSTHIYWTNLTGTKIGRANIDGTGIDPNFITGASSPDGVAVDSAHIYWANSTAPGTIGRANLDGNPASVNQSFITGATTPCGVAVDSAHVLWTNVGNSMTGGGTIGRANLDGTSPDQSFITGASGPCGVAVDSLPSNAFSFGKLKRNKRKGTAILTVIVPGPGTLQLSGRGLVKQRPAGALHRPRTLAKVVSAAGSVKLKIRSKGKKRRKLNRTGRVKVKAKVTFTPTGNVPNTRSRRIKLVKKR